MQNREARHSFRALFRRRPTPLEGSISRQAPKQSLRRAARRAATAASSAGVLAVLLAALAPSHHAYSFKRFIVPSGDWAVGANWLNGLPTASDDVMVQFGYTATVSSAGAVAGNLFVGGFGDSGNLVVTDAGVLAVSNSFTMYGTSSLSVQNGGTLNVTTPVGQGSTIGASAGTETVTVSGTGSSFTYSGGLLILGGTTSNVTNFTVSGGGLFSTSSMIYLGNSGGTGNLTVTGANSRMTSTNSLYIGASSAAGASMTINAGGQVSDASAILGSFGTTGNVTVSDVGSSWTTSGSVFIGTANTNTGGTVLVQNGATASSGSLSIGTQNGLAATLTVTGTGSTWTDNGAFTLAANALATVNVSAGGKLAMKGNASLSSTFTITDPGSVWTNTAVTTINGNSGIVSLLNGATANTGAVNINQTLTSPVTVSGTGTSWTAGALNITDASATAVPLLITGGGSMTTTGLMVSSGNVDVSGSGSSLGSTGDSYVGSSSGGASVTVESGATLTTGGTMHIAWFSPAVGSMTVTGAGSVWNANNIQVGQGGIGSLNVTSGGSIVSSSFAVGSSNFGNSNGSATVSGTGSKLNTATLIVGDVGPGSLSINGGALLQSTTSSVGGSNGGTGTVTLSDAGTQWKTAGLLGIDNASTVTVDGGTTLSVNNGASGITIGGFSSFYNGYSHLNIGTGGPAGTVSASSITSSGVIGFNFTNSLNFSIPISGFGSVTKAGSGTLTLSTNNTFYAGLTATGGTIIATAPLALGDGAVRLSNTTLVLANDNPTNFGGDQSVPVSITISTDTTIVSDRLTPGAGVTHGLGYLNFSGTTLTLNAGANVTSGIAGLNFAGSTLGTNQTLNVASNVSASLGGYSYAGTLTKIGPGILMVGTNGSTGSAIVVNGGVFQEEASMSSSHAVPVTVNATLPGVNASYILDNINRTVQSLVLGGAGGSGTSANNVDTGDSTLTITANLTYDATSNPLGSVISGALNFGGAGQLVTVGHSTNANVDLTISADILGGSFTKNGPGMLELTGYNYHAYATLASGQTVATGQANAVPFNLTMSGGTLTLAYNSSINPNTDLTLTTDATITASRLTAGSGYTTSFDSLTMGGGQTLTFNAGANVTGGTIGLTIRAAGFAGQAILNTGAGTVISLGTIFNSPSNSNPASNSLTKIGPGTVVVGATGYTGATDIQSGKIIVSGSLAGSLVIEAAAVGASDHNVSASVALLNVLSNSTGGGTFAPGDIGGSGLSTIGRLLVTGNVTLGSPSTFGVAHLSIELGGLTSGTQYDQIAMKGTLTLADVNLDGAFVNGFTPAIGNEFFLFTGATSVSGVFGNQLAPDALSGGLPRVMIGTQEFAISYSANAGSGSLTGGHDVALLALVPEPGAAGLLLAGGVLCGMRRRKRGHA